MKLRSYLLISAAMLATIPTFTACDDDEPNTTVTPTPEPTPTPTPEEPSDPWANADVVTWPGDTIVNISEHFTVPEGKSLVIEIIEK